MKEWSKKLLECPQCHSKIADEALAEAFRLTCPRCSTEWQIQYRYHWLLVCLALALGFTLAYICGLDGPLFFVAGLAFWLAIHVAAAPLVYRVLPKRLVTPTGAIQNLGITSRKD